MMAPHIRRDATQRDKIKIKISKYLFFLHACSISVIAREESSPPFPRAVTGREGQRKEGFAASIPRSQDPGIVPSGGPRSDTVVQVNKS